MGTKRLGQGQRGNNGTVESLEARQLMAADLRAIDGTGNNLLHPTWGATNTPLLRVTPASYSDGKSTPAGANRPSARAISNAIASHPADQEILSKNSLSAFSYLWGQFIDHDLDLTSSASPSESLNVNVPAGDPSFDPFNTGTQIIPLTRSNYVTDAKGVRQQVNDITSFLDGSMVYGSDATRAAALRTFSGGRMKTTAGDLLPFNTGNLPNANDAHIFPGNQLFLAGDVRANENSELTALQTLFVREHNRLAGKVAAANPKWNDEQVYQQARRLVIGEIQNITYNEFLPALLGPTALPKYTGYKPTVNPSISNEFSTAAYRLGHSMLTDDVEFINDDGSEFQDPLLLAQVFFNPTVVQSTGVDPILKYLASSNSEEIDTKIVDSVRNFLFGPPGAGGLDLASLNIQRGRDHGLASYNDTRAALGLPRVTNFNQITSDASLAASLKAVYGDVKNVDLWVGGLAEDHVRGSNLGATFQKIIVDQFTRTRDGDRFWFERDLAGSDLATVKGMTLAKIIKANTHLTNLQDNVFVFDVDVTGKVFVDADRNGQQNGWEFALPGVRVQLVGEDGDVVATTTTGRDGSYSFQNLGLGAYSVKPILPRGIVETNKTAPGVYVSRGGALTCPSIGLWLQSVPTSVAKAVTLAATKLQASQLSDLLK